MFPRIIEAPWTIIQIQILNDYQFSGKFHEYTCIQSHHRRLVASFNGWFCLDCNYTQNWAWEGSLYAV